MKKSITCIMAGIIWGILLFSPIKTKAAEQEAYELTIEDAQLLMRLGQAEAGDQGEDGIFLIMCVVLNRVDSDRWPDTIREVVYQEHQFATPADIDDVCLDCHLALARIEMGERIPGIIGFENKRSKVLDSYFDRAFEEGDHRFYTVKTKR